MSDPAPTSEQLRARIDTGRTGEKVDFPDPAAAPAAADAEAGGRSNSATERRMEAATAPVAPPRRDVNGVAIYAGMVTGAAVLVLGAASLAGWL